MRCLAVTQQESHEEWTRWGHWIASFNAKVFDLELDDEDRSRIEAVTRKGRNLFQRIGDCGDEYRG